jgi:hypothetical protein
MDRRYKTTESRIERAPEQMSERKGKNKRKGTSKGKDEGWIDRRREVGPL